MRITSRFRAVAGSLAALLVSSGLLVVTAAPAQAYTSKCTGWQQKTLRPPGHLPYLFEVKMCVATDDEGHWATAIFHATTDDATVPQSLAFDKVAIGIRLERYDADIRTNSCDITYDVNHPGTWGSWWIEKRCRTTKAPLSSETRYGWSGDGYVKYNLNNDGEGDFTWSLHGSPLAY